VVIFALAVATAVIVGSLIIGDSVTGSIARSALSRLGNIHYALTAPDWFRADLADGLADPRPLPMILLSGAARNASTGAVVPKVAAIGVDPALWAMYSGARDPGLSGRDAAVNASLAGDLGLSVGDSLLLTVSHQTDVPTDTLFGRRERQDAMRGVRLRVSAIIPDQGVGAFRLDAQPGTPRNIFIDRRWLAGELGREGRANAMVAGAANGRSAEGRPAEVIERVQEGLKQAVKLADYGLKLVPSSHGYLSVQSPGLVLPASVTEAANAAAADCSARSDPTSVYLAETIEPVGDDSAPKLAYAVVAGVGSLSPVHIVDREVRDLGDGLVLNRWAADDLHAELGRTYRLTYLIPSWEEGYRTASLELTLRGIIGTAGMGADRDLVPDFEGITNAERIDDWKPPFPVDLDRVTERDEEYWDLHRAAPKAFVSLDTARRLWSSGPAGGGADWITSVRIYPGRDRTIRELAKVYEPALLGRLSPTDAGLVFRPVRQIALSASKGTSDFGQLFLGMSFFLVLSGAGLAGMLMRLSADRRASQAGVMMACGFTAGSAAHVILTEGAALAIPGALLGVPLGVAYGWAIIRALGTWWRAALGVGPELWLFVSPTTLAEGGLAGLAVGLVAAWWAARRLSRSGVLDLLAGWQSLQTIPRGRPRGPMMMTIAVAAVVTVVLMILALAGAIPAETAFFIIGTALLVAGLSGASLALGRAMRVGRAASADALLAVRNAAAGRGRSLLVIGLLAAAAFVVVAVAANSRNFSALDVTSKRSGTGGFSLLATSSIPLPYDFGTPEGRAALGFPPEDEQVFEGVQTISLLASPGEDMSCLNIARPSHPRVLGISDRMIERDGFRLSARGGGDNPWKALLARRDDGTIPAFGDAASVQWQLHSGRGKTYSLPTEDGGTATLRFVGLLSGSIFQSEILVHKSQLKRLYPSVDAPSYFLIATPPERTEQVAEALRRNLGDAGLRVRSTAEVLNAYISVQNTYLSMFLALGGLGLMLGSVGLVAVLLRSALERRGEFALMLATGFDRSDLSRILVYEHAGLLVIGLAMGTIAALVAVAPQLVSSVSSVNWLALLIVLLGILIVGLAACALSARIVVRGSLIEALREE
ncbi:MAG TPA: ABC transporter permease, partial [Armatimonadota bacterium]|nr:ABC transporter permease [Armatimonadota bacterium]